MKRNSRVGSKNKVVIYLVLKRGIYFDTNKRENRNNLE